MHTQQSHNGTSCKKTKENVAMADKLVVSQEDETQMHHSTHPVTQFAATPTEGLTETMLCIT